MPSNIRIHELQGVRANIASGVQGNAVTTDYDSSFNNAGYCFAYISLNNVLATTTTIWGTADLDSVGNASAVWDNMTQALFGVPNFTSASILIIDTPIAAARLRIETLTTAATNTIAIRVSLSG